MQETAQRLLDEAEREAERQIAILRAVLGVLFLVLIQLTAFVVPEGAETTLRQLMAARIVAALLILVGLGAYFALTRGFGIRRLAFLTATFDALLVLSVLANNLLSDDVPGSFFFIFPGIWVVPILLAITAVRYRPRLQAWVGFLYVGGLGIVMMIGGPVPIGERAEILSRLVLGFGVPPNLIRLSMIAAAAFILVLVARRGRRLLERAVAETSMRMELTRFLPGELAPVITDPELAELGRGKRQKVAIAFVDMRDSAGWAERMEAEAFAGFMTGFRGLVSQAAAETGGIVDKFIGDGALVLFGALRPAADDAARSLAFARRLLRLLDEWNAREGHAPPARAGIGLHQGEVFCGIVGSDERREFTVLGDAANVAARLQEATKDFSVPLLASASLLTEAGETTGWEQLAERPLRGRHAPVRLMAPRELLTPPG
ncbi:adenylate/guanylate cyclase domain-containing protein [Afifella sp. IM 167]|uniref:adenylate/guanylate cyclase domain-containing protein n=1 Tax=Afifella sp. IM 167 TaxID=2033586 RepID=UPI001CCF3C0D|nr:adenylate/guanylate cyclase domain-containing protein [Afifella sp. IM 167]MBZ8135178.1 hypothetical protein [Afifella sp. IM 167]